MMPSLKKLQPREKNLLVGLAITAVIVFLAQIVFMPQYDKMVALEAKRAGLEVRLAEINLQIAAREGMGRRISKDLDEVSVSAENYFPSIVQEKIILFLNEETDNVDIHASYGFTETTQREIDAVFTTKEKEAFLLGDMAYEYRKNSGEEETVEEALVYVPNDSNKIDISVVTMAYKATYDNLIKLINSLEEYPKNIIITSLNASYNEKLDLLDGTMTIEFYGLPKLVDQESDMGYLTWDIIKEYGKDDPFGKFTFGASFQQTLQQAQPTYSDDQISDFFAIIKPVASDAPAALIGRGNNDDTTYIQKDSATLEKLTLTLSGSKGNYSYSYKLGDKVYPASGNASLDTLKDDKIIFYIFSSKRGARNDVSGVTITVNNGSDLPLEIIVDGDDATNPRVSFSSTNGTVSIIEK